MQCLVPGPGVLAAAGPWFGPWWRTGALADGSRHGAGVFGPMVPLGRAGRTRSKVQKYPNEILGDAWRQATAR